MAKVQRQASAPIPEFRPLWSKQFADPYPDKKKKKKGKKGKKGKK